MLGNVVSVVILIALVALFVWLTRRAWGSKRNILKWPALVLSGLLALLLALMIVFAMIGFYKLNEQHNNPVANVQVARTPQQIARGEKLANMCVKCHTSNGRCLSLAWTF